MTDAEVLGTPATAGPAKEMTDAEVLAPPVQDRPVDHSGVLDRINGGFQTYAHDTATFFKEGIQQTVNAPGQIIGAAPNDFEDTGAQIEKSMLEMGTSKEDAKREADRMMRKLQSREGVQGLVMGPLQALTSWVLGGVRSGSRAIEAETGFPKEGAEVLGMSALAAAGLRLGRVRISPEGEVSAQPIGGLPTSEDFAAAAKTLGSKEAETNLKRMWTEDGIHPAEAVHDAANDAFLKHQITEPPLASLSADITDPKNLPPPVSPEVQPLSVPGRIISDLKSLRDQTFDAAQWVQRSLAPISTGPDYAVRYTTEYLSALRRVTWDYDRYDKYIKDNLNLGEQEDVWRALDEESVMSRTGERVPDTGFDTLNPKQLAIAKELSAHAITTRLQMIDRGMVKDEGLPHYVPRVFSGIEKGESVSIGETGRFRTTDASLKERKYLTAEESEAAAKAKYGDQVELVRNVRTLPLVLARQQRAIAAHDMIEGIRKFGQDIGDPQIVEGEAPKGEEAKWIEMPGEFKTASGQIDAEGKPVMVPMKIKSEWRDMIKAIGDSKFNNWDKFITEVKNRPMSLIMNSPFIHASVVWSKALPANPGNLLTGRFLRQGPQLLADPKFMREMIDSGLVLWGRRPTLKQDVSSMMEEPQINPGRSVTSQVLAYIPDLFSKEAGDATKRAIDRVGEIVHDKLLAENVQKLQASLAYDFRETLRKSHPGIPDEALNVLASHEANRFGGSLPAEAMSAFTRGFTNAILFSRQFTLGNLGVLKDAVKGPPEYVMGRVRDLLGKEGDNEATQLKNSMARHAAGIVALDVAMYYGMNAFLQSTIQVASGTPMADEVAGYWWRLKQASNRIAENPTSLSSYLSFLPSLSPTFYHEPGKDGKLLLGKREDGTAIYGRSVIGRMGEDYTGLVINPAMWLTTKMAPLPRALMELVNNRDGFDRPIIDPKAFWHGHAIETGIAIGQHLMEAQLPMQQVNGAMSLAKGTGDYKDIISVLGPYAPPPLTITASQGYPGGPVAGAVASNQRDMRTRQDLSMAELKDMVVNKGDIVGAKSKMAELGVKPGLQNFLVRNWQHPGASKTTTRALMGFYNHASPVEKEIMDTMRGMSP